MHGFRKLIRLDEAINRFVGILEPIKETEKIHIRESLDRVLARDVVAEADIPPFDRAAMDGYAARAEDIYDADPENPKVLRVIGISEIGKPFEGKVSVGEAVYVHTGSKIPIGADVVVPIEYVDVVDDEIFVRKSFAPGDNISRRGEDISKGTKVLRAGRLIAPEDIAIMKALGMRYVEVLRRPRIAVMACGSELVDDPEELGPGKILEYSREIVIGYSKKLGAEVIDFGISPDSEQEILKKIQLAQTQIDMLITVGGTSVGKHDLIPHIIRKYGELIFHGVAIEPGKPICAGKIGRLPILGLPGLPVATFIAVRTILLGAIERISSIRGRFRHSTIRAALGRRIWSKPGIRTYVRVKLIRKNSMTVAEPIMIAGSGVLSSVVMSDGIVEVPEGSEGIEEGKEVEVILIRDVSTV